MADVVEVNVSTGEVIERGYTSEELTQKNQDRINNQILAQELKDKYDQDIIERNAIIQKFVSFGLSEEEANKIVPSVSVDYRIIHLL